MALSENDFGSDSLLDTVTNAVGVLIIVLAVSYLTLHDTVSRVSRQDSIASASPAESLEAQMKTSEYLDATIRQLRLEWRNASHRLDSDRAQSTAIRARTALLSDHLSRFDLKGVHAQTVLLALERDQDTIASLEEEVRELQQRIAQRQSISGLQRKLPKPKVSTVRVPDPVPAPRGAHKLVFLCRYARVVPYATEEMVGCLHRGITEALAGNRASSQLKISDLGKVVSYFNEQQIGQNGLNWRLQVVHRVDAAGTSYRELRASLVWATPEVGETLDQLQSTQSHYRRLLAGGVSQHAYAQYYVWGDSFAEYTVARELADEVGVPAGWVAKEGDAEYEVALLSTHTERSTPALAPMPNRPPPTPVPRIGLGIGLPMGSSGSSGSASSFRIVGAGPGSDYVD